VILTLELSGSAKSGVAPRKVFTESGGTIGRDAKSFWVLPDGEVSGRHALISCRNGVFYIEDTNSTNGISINSVEDRLVPSQCYPLTSGDRIGDVAHRCGFGDAVYFGRRFRQWTGVTPRQFRNEAHAMRAQAAPG